MQQSGAAENRAPEGAIDDRLVRHIDTLNWHKEDSARWACAFGSRQGTRMLSLHVVEAVQEEISLPPRPGSETVLYVLDGDGMVSIAGHDFAVSAGDGVFVRKGESLAVRSLDATPLKMLMAICPSCDSPWGETGDSTPAGSDPFDETFPVRVVSAGNADREATGDRYFKILVGPKIGSRAITQFIGSIPLSKAPEHFHLYEEVICVLSGEGRIWIGDANVPVCPGSLVFLPRKQPHCMECTTDQGLELLGMFYPAGSPAVNYATPEQE